MFGALIQSAKLSDNPISRPQVEVGVFLQPSEMFFLRSSGRALGIGKDIERSYQTSNKAILEEFLSQQLKLN